MVPEGTAGWGGEVAPAAMEEACVEGDKPDQVVQMVLPVESVLREHREKMGHNSRRSEYRRH